MRQPSQLLTASAFILALSAATACTSPDPTPEQTPSKLAGLTEGWNAIEPGGETTCSDGSPFRFFVRPGSEAKRDQHIHFYLEGGGGCWSGATCDVQGRPTYTPVVDPSDGQASTGVFNLDRDDNPLRGHTTIFVPYCGGDVHLGDRTVEYTAPAADGREERKYTIEHHGLDNGTAALDWMYSHFDDPSAVFVSGSSAGSIPSPVYATWIKEHWPGARVAQLGDGAGGYRGASESKPYLQWGTLGALNWGELVGLEDTLSFEDLYVASAKRAANVQYAQYDTAEDDVQLQFLQLAGTPTPSLLPLLDANHEEIAAAAPNFRSFVAGGELHTILRRPEVYTYRVGDTTFLEWLTDLVEGRDVHSVRCSDCSQPEGVMVEEAAPSPSSE